MNENNLKPMINPSLPSSLKFVQDLERKIVEIKDTVQLPKHEVIEGGVKYLIEKLNDEFAKSKRRGFDPPEFNVPTLAAAAEMLLASGESKDSKILTTISQWLKKHGWDNIESYSWTLRVLSKLGCLNKETVENWIEKGLYKRQEKDGSWSSNPTLTASCLMTLSHFGKTKEESFGRGTKFIIDHLREVMQGYNDKVKHIAEITVPLMSINSVRGSDPQIVELIQKFANLVREKFLEGAVFISEEGKIIQTARTLEALTEFGPVLENRKSREIVKWLESNRNGNGWGENPRETPDIFATVVVLSALIKFRKQSHRSFDLESNLNDLLATCQQIKQSLSEEKDKKASSADLEKLKSLEAELRKLKSMTLVNPHWKGRNFEVEPDFCFLLMPFRELWSNDVWKLLESVITKCGFRCQRADEKEGRVIMDDIWEGICKARFVIADLTAKNPNVTYEVGLADVLGKEIILLSQTPNDVPFDFLGLRLITYENSIGGVRKLSDELERRLRKNQK